ncbi:MAG: chemotaxis protein CheD [Acidobacteriia bacterium]|nr:chemotaxis protein CheD [Terriglobia bacterium]
MSRNDVDPAALPREVPVSCTRKDSHSSGLHFLYPGQIFVAREAITISTILGSCAAICLWDMRRRMGGMNHYLLPEGSGDGPNRFRYGSIANPALLRELLALGCQVRDLQARVFGGASAFAVNPITAMGTRNVELAEQFLFEAGIPVMARDVSGKHGRKLTFNTSNGATEIKSFQQGQ